MRTVSVGFGIICLLGSAATAMAAPASLAVRSSLGLGHDDNIFREADNRDSGWYFPFSFSAEYDRPLSVSDRLLPELYARGRLYPAPNQDGNDTRVGFDLQYDRRLIGHKRGVVRVPSLDLSLGASAAVRHTTYFSRSLGEELAVPGDDGPVLLGDRYDAGQFAGTASLACRWPRDTRWQAEFRLLRKDYLHDYDEAPSVDPLDYDDRRLALSVEQGILDGVDVELSYTHSSVDYDAWIARDLDGNQVPGRFQEFRYRTWAARFAYERPDLAGISLEVHTRTRTDPFQAYYDYDQWGLAPRLELDFLPNLEIDLQYEYFHREYDRARVGFNPLRPLRDDFDRAFHADVEYRFGVGRRLYLDLVRDNVDEKNPLYTFTRLRTSFGIMLDY